MTSQVDWPRLLGDLQWMLGEPELAFPQVRKPMSTQALAKHLDVPRMTLVGYMEGADPKHAQGERLIAEWCALSGKRREFLPMASSVLSAAKVR